MLVAIALGLVAARPANAQGRTEYMVPMDDGTELATDVYRFILDPFDYPVVLIRTPYGKDTSEMQTLAYFLLNAGYVAVVQDERGTGHSQGTNELFRADGWGTLHDGYDTVKWIAKRSWCDGNVGMFGLSALGISAYLAAGARPPALKCEVVAFSAADLYDQAAYQGGELRAELIDSWVGAQNPTKLQEILDHEVRTSYWDILDAEDREPTITIPTLHIGGWYDCFLQGTLNHFAGLQARGATGARNNQKLIVGPWTHVNFNSRTQGELTYPSNSTLSLSDLNDETKNWFDYWLAHKGTLSGPRVHYYVMGEVGQTTTRGNQWRDSDTWPPATQPQRLFLWAGGELWGQAARGRGVEPESYVYDPRNPVPTRGGANLDIDAGPYDQRPVEARNDVLVYTSQRLTQPLEVTGRITVELYASSTARDTDWTAKLCDVYPDGRSMLVCDGVLKARCRDSVSSPTLINRRTIYRYQIDLWSTSIEFNTGHRIRLTISSSNSPRFEPNANDGRNVRSGFPPSVAVNTIYHDAVRPSAIVLPVSWPTAPHPVFGSTRTDAGKWPLYR